MTETGSETNNTTRDFVALLQIAVAHATFELERFGTFSGLQLTHMYRTYTGFNRLYLQTAKLRLEEELLGALADSLRCLLSSYIENDRIGNGLVFFVGGIPEPDMLGYTRDMVRAAAMLGPSKVGQLLYGWARGEPIRHRVCAVLSGLSVDEPIVMGRGISFRKLPGSSNVLMNELPPTIDMQFGIMEMAGATKVTLDCQGSPALYKAGTDPATQTTWEYGPLELSSLDALCDALSLASNSCVRFVIAWSDFGDLSAIRGGSGYTSRGGSEMTYGGPKMLREDCEKAKELLAKRLDDQLSNKKLDLAISRWMSSKRGGSVADQFIDLRIALEALYPSDGIFRLATRGAWHLGANFEDRLTCHETLQKAYKFASGVIHARTKSYTHEDETLLRDAQDLCRRGILKRLDEGKAEPNWKELILGKEI